MGGWADLELPSKSKRFKQQYAIQEGLLSCSNGHCTVTRHGDLSNPLQCLTRASPAAVDSPRCSSMDIDGGRSIVRWRWSGGP